MFTPSTFAALRASSLRIFHSCNIRQMEEIEQIDKVLMIVIDISDSDNDVDSNGNIVGGSKNGGTCMHCQSLATLPKNILPMVLSFVVLSPGWYNLIFACRIFHDVSFDSFAWQENNFARASQLFSSVSVNPKSWRHFFLLYSFAVVDIYVLPAF